MDRVSKTAIAIALVLTLAIGFGYSRFRRFEQRQQEINRLRQTIEDAAREVEQKEQAAAEMESELKVMESDPAAREAAARQGLRWVREGEKVYIVEEPWEVVTVGGPSEEDSGSVSGRESGSTSVEHPDAVTDPPSARPELAPLVPPDGEPAAAGSP